MVTRLSRLVGCGSCFVASLALAAGGCQGQGQEELQQEQVSLPDRHVDSTAGVAIVRKPSSLPAANYASDDQEHQKTIIPFLNRHCVRCHGPEVQEASFRVDQVANDFLTRSVAERWSEIFDRLHLGDMPPRDEPRPPADGIARVTDWISRERLRGEQARRGTGIVIRRLNRVEYQNTIRDLIGVDLLSTEEFPADPPAGGFDNNGAVLTISPLHLELYLKTAQAVVDRAIVTGQDRPPVIKWRVELEAGETAIAEQFHKQIRGQFIYGSGGNVPVRNGMAVLRQEKMWSQTNGRNFAQLWGFEIPRAGVYAVRIRAAGVVQSEGAVRRAGPEVFDRKQRGQETDLPHVRKHFAEDRRYRYGPPRLKLLCNLGNDRLLGEFDVDAPEGTPREYEVRAWMEPGPSGIMIRNVYHLPGHNWNWIVQEEDDFPRPELLLDWVELEGPLYDAWPPSSHRRILIDSAHKGKSEEAYAREVLENFMRQAYRRPLRDGEVDSKVALFQLLRPNCSSLEDAIKTPLVAVLSSPHFLYLVEDDSSTVPSSAPGTDSTSITPASDTAASRRLSDFEIGARLSYFLWSSMPDDELFLLARQGLLGNPQALAGQVDRMLADPRSEQFVKNFAGQWLNLRGIGVNPPAQQIYTQYDDHLELSIRGESEAFVAHLLRNDLSVMNFIRSDFVTINERLARHYDIPGVKGDHFRAVKVPTGLPRGGLVTQASVLAVTSNGTRTSPVWRGAWILERMLGDPPTPPPPNAGDIPPGVPGADNATVRARLQIHREQKQCAGCHNKIDPLGFALENFNAAGEWREREARGRTSDYGPDDPLIDARAKLPGGSEFVGVGGLQDELLNRKDRFLRCLAEKVYVYALGRELGYADQPLIDSAVVQLKEKGDTLRSLIHHVVTSEAFRSK